MKRKKFLIASIMVLMIVLMVSCVNNEESLPEVNVGYIFTNHQTPLMVAAFKGEDFKDEGVYLKEVIDREKYILVKEDEEIANINLVVTRNGTETMTMMSQGHLDIGLASSAAFLSARDQGIDVNILCPVHTEGIGMVMDKDTDVNDWDDFVKFLDESSEPVKVGYHSPTSAPLILFEAAIREAGLSYTKDPNQSEKDILLVDLRGTNNLLPALLSNQVDAWVGPSPFPELAEVENAGKIVLDMKHMPPEGKWYDFPCCTLGAREETIKDNEYIIDSFIELLTVSAEYSMANPEEAAIITSDFTGVSVEAAAKSSITYTTKPTDVWVNNLGLMYETLLEAESFNGEFEGKKYDEIKDIIFDFRFYK